MECEKCKAQIPDDSAACPECKSLVVQNIEGFEYTKQVQKALKQLVIEQSERIADKDQLIAMMYDYLPEYQTERELLALMVNKGILDVFLRAGDKTQAITDAREKMVMEYDIPVNGAEFVLAAFTYMLRIPYASKLRLIEKPKETDKEKEKPKEIAPDIDDRVMTRIETIKYRLKKNITVKEGYTKIDGYCFEGFGFARSITLPDGLLAIGEYAFTDCKHLTEIVIPASVKKIEKGAFNSCVSLTDIKLPDGLLEIGDNTFLCCEALEHLRIPDSVSSIGANAFSGCDKLKKLVVNKNVKFIDDDAFSYCPELTVYCYENSYIHKYCLQYKINFITSAVGTALPADDIKEE